VEIKKEADLLRQPLFCFKKVSLEVGRQDLSNFTKNKKNGRRDYK